jgi:hypothetical protein
MTPSRFKRKRRSGVLLAAERRTFAAQFVVSCQMSMVGDFVTSDPDGASVPCSFKPSIPRHLAF